MVAIGSCDWCGEYCAQLWVYPPDDGYGRASDSQIEQHRDLVGRRLDCSGFEDGMLVPPDHVGPMHRRDGTPYRTCRHCTSRSWMAGDGEWDATLDHSDCLQCWERTSGAQVLLDRIRSSSSLAPRRSATEPLDIAGLSTSTAPADRKLVERTIADYVGPNGFKVRWVESPRGVADALFGRLEKRGYEVGNRHWSLWNLPSSDRATLQNLRHEIWAPNASMATVRRAIAHAIAGSSSIATDESGIEIVLADSGQFELESLSVQAEVNGGPYVRLIAELAQMAGPFVVLPREIVISDRPLLLRLDDAGRVHCDDGPAIAYADGLSAWAWHGVPVDRTTIEEPDAIDIAAIDAEPNAERRRVLIERFGADRLIREGGSKLVHEDETGRLWRRELVAHRGHRWDEAVWMVEVVNATPEPDGSRRTYFLRVPPTMRTAREAVAWTFGMRTEEYSPAAQT